MSIFPLPVFERDSDPANRTALTDDEIYAKLKPPTSIVVRFGRMKLIGEYPYRGDAKPGCGSKMVVKTFRALEIADMLTTTCSNSGCGKSVSRREMLEYVENSGGRDYPFQTQGEVLRVATIEDLNQWSAAQAGMKGVLQKIRAAAEDARFPAKIVDVEPVLDESVLVVYYLSDERIDFRFFVERLAPLFNCRIEMRQVGARDEARLVADYERCGQHCCCKNFLKVLKPISMKSAKTQKATLDPLKISGRCGRLMCCLRYEDETYEELKKRLPRNKSRVGTVEGPGIVLESKILVQLVLVRLDADGRDIAVPVEELCDPDACPTPATAVAPDPMRGMSSARVQRKVADPPAARGAPPTKDRKQDAYREKSQRFETNTPVAPTAPSSNTPNPDAPVVGESASQKKRRRRKRKKQADAANAAALGVSPTPSGAPTQSQPRAQSDGNDNDEGGADDDVEDGIEGSIDGSAQAAATPGVAGEGTGKRKRRRRKRKNRGPSAGGNASGAAPDSPPQV
ncbi:MAG: hypothetical protein EXS10_07840 [Phycisphaerales bacterium]|nr:hypothetical protein [Phycisphaerales bacterium]